MIRHQSISLRLEGQLHLQLSSNLLHKPLSKAEDRTAIKYFASRKCCHEDPREGIREQQKKKDK